MPLKPKILITSAGGKTGMPTALKLLQKGYPVRAFLHRDDARALRLRTTGAEIFIGDQYALTDMRRAMSGVQRAYHCAPTAPDGLHFGAIFAAAAHEARLEHVVSLSQWLSNADHPSLFTREVYLNDSLLAILPQTSVTTINVGWFADNYFMVLEPVAQLGLLPMPLGDGSLKKDAPPSTEDIAAVNVGALIDPENHSGKVYRPTGPELLSPVDIAATMEKVLGRPVRYSDISETMFMKALWALRPANFSPAAATQLRIYTEEYRRGTFAVGGPTDAVEQVTGQPPESFEAIARREVTIRREAARSVRNRIRAVANFIKIFATAARDPKAIEQKLGYRQLVRPMYSQDSGAWINSHSRPTTSAKTLAAIT